MDRLDNILYARLSPDIYCLVHNQIVELQRENKKLEEKLYDEVDISTSRLKENKDLKEKNEFLMKRDNKCQILEQVINKTLKTINELKTTGWVNGENGTTTGYTYAKPCCKTRLNIIEDILREVE